MLEQRLTDIDQLMAEEMTEMASIVTQALLPDNEETIKNTQHHNTVSLQEIQSQGTNSCGF